MADRMRLDSTMLHYLAVRQVVVAPYLLGLSWIQAHQLAWSSWLTKERTARAALGGGGEGVESLVCFIMKHLCNKVNRG